MSRHCRICGQTSEDCYCDYEDLAETEPDCADGDTDMGAA